MTNLIAIVNELRFEPIGGEYGSSSHITGSHQLADTAVVASSESSRHFVHEILGIVAPTCDVLDHVSETLAVSWRGAV